MGGAERTRREPRNYSMIYTSKPLKGHGRRVECSGGIHCCGEEPERYHNKGEVGGDTMNFTQHP